MFIVEGTIGAGKSTFLTILHRHVPGISIAHEPLDSWSSENVEKSLLAKFYESQKRWAYTIETTTMMTRVRQHIKESENPNPYHVMERSIYSGHYVFALNGYKNGSFTQLEWELYLRWFDVLINKKCKPPHGFIYLRVSPEVAFERIKKRSRSAEVDLTFSYLQQIHKHHDDFLVKKQDVLPELKNAPVLILDCDKEFEDDAEQQKKIVEKTLSFMQQHAAKATPRTQQEKIVI